MRLRSLPNWAQRFAEQYVESEASWYLTKGVLVSRGTLSRLQAQLRVLNTYRGQVWQKCQVKYARELERGGLYKARKKFKSVADYTARVRMLKVCFESLGLAWTDDENGTVALTSVGKSFVKCRRLDKLEEVAGHQICKWQLVNPSLHRGAYQDLRVYPYYAMLSALAGLPDSRLTKDEFAMFVMRMSTGDERETRKTIARVRRFRQLSDVQGRKLRKALASQVLYTSKARRPTSLFLRVERVASYLLPFLALGPHVEMDDDQGIKIRTGYRNRAAEVVKRHRQEETWIYFSTRKDWLSFYGDPRRRPTFHAALDIYRDRSDAERARKTVTMAQAKGQAPEIGEEWLTSIERERVLEEYLNWAPQALEKGLKIAELRGRRGRQYPTRAGPVDLLGLDRKGSYVVIELKKGRSSREVVGQLLDYVGALRQEHGWQRIRGFIVTEKVDAGLRRSFRELLSRPGRHGWRLYSAEFKARFRIEEPASA